MARILLLDNSPDDIGTVSHLLIEKGHTDLTSVATASEAIDHLRANPPELLLVDPAVAEAQGDEFYSRAREVAPHTPIVVVSARGHEEQAVRALRSGAASFVPKHLVQQHLIETIRAVLQVARNEKSHLRMLELMTELKCTFVLENDPTLVSPLVAYVQDHMQRMELCSTTELTRVGIAIHEALTNAIFHGNLELDSALRENGNDHHELFHDRRQKSPYAERRVHVGMLVNAQRARITIRDEGPGFDRRRLPDPTDLKNVDKVSGRGIFLIRTFMDRVAFNAQGNEIVMWKNKDTNMAHPDSAK